MENRKRKSENLNTPSEKKTVAKSKSSTKSETKINVDIEKDINTNNNLTPNKSKSVISKPTTSENWENIKDSLLIKNFSSTTSNKIIGFDLDDTLIKPISGAKFSKDSNDWKLLYNTSKLKEYFNNGYRIVIFTNQLGISKGLCNEHDWKLKIDSIQKELDIPILVIASLKNDYNRKPSIGMWKYLETGTSSLDKENSIYVGDAAGRQKNSSGKKDHSDSDYKFALNIGIKFMTPEEFFKGDKSYANLNPSKFDFDPKIYIDSEDNKKNLLKLIDINTQPEMIIFVGSPASGKSTLAHKYLIPVGYVHVNNDTLKTAVKCQKLAEESLSKGKSVIIDNTNPSKATRDLYISLAEKYKVPVRCFYFNFPKNLIFHLNNLRSIYSNTYSPPVPDVVIHTWYKKCEEPNLAEGFKEIINIPFVLTEDKFLKELFYMYSS